MGKATCMTGCRGKAALLLQYHSLLYRATVKLGDKL